MEGTECGLAIGRGRVCPNPCSSLKAPGLDGVMRPVCEKHGELFGWPTRARAQWLRDGWANFDKTQKIAYWVELQNGEGLPPQKSCLPPTGPPSGPTTGPPPGAQRGRHTQRRPDDGAVDDDGERTTMEQQLESMRAEAVESSQRHIGEMEQLNAQLSSAAEQLKLATEQVSFS